MPRRRIYKVADCPLLDHPTTDECRLCPHWKGFDYSNLWVDCDYEIIPRAPETDEEYNEKW